MFNNFYLAIIISLIFCSFTFSQEPVSSPTPTPTPVKKANQRPPESAAESASEPFDKTDIKSLLEKCVRLETEAGNIELEFFPETAPDNVRNFLNLVAIKFFDTTLFSRIVQNFVVQGGNFSTRLQKPIELYERSKKKVKDEPSMIKHERGVLSMARSEEPNSATTHFFILVSDAPHLDGTFTAFGRVIGGMEIVDEMNKMPLVDEKPEKPVRLQKATIISCPVKPEAENSKL